jgi:ATP-dependent DNA helicase RecG
MRLVEQVGSGIGRIKDLMQEASLTPPEFSTKGMFSIILRRPFDFEKWVNKWVDNLSENRLAIIRAIHKDAAITKKELEAAVGIGATAIDNNLEYLKSIGLLDRIGTKGGKWVIRFIDPEVGK